MVDLKEIQELIFRTVDALSSQILSATKRDRLTKGLAALRSAERDYLAQHSSVLSKSAGEGSYDAFLADLRRVKSMPGPAPAAPTDATLPANHESRAWRAPKELAGMRIHTSAGFIDVPPHGVVNTSAPVGHDEDRCDCVSCTLHKELRGRGFKEMRARKSAGEVALDQIREVHRLGKARQIAVGIVSKQRADAGDDVGNWLHNRAAKAGIPSEERLPQYDGPGPSPQYASSAAEFRRQYYGEQ